MWLRSRGSVPHKIFNPCGDVCSPQLHDPSGISCYFRVHRQGYSLFHRVHDNRKYVQKEQPWKMKGTGVLTSPSPDLHRMPSRPRLWRRRRMKTRKRSVGRPKLPPNEVRVLIAVRVTPAERKEFERRAKGSGVSLSDWIRTTLMKAGVNIEGFGIALLQSSA